MEKTDKIRVHRCFSIELGETVPLVCACRKYIKESDAKRAVMQGFVQWVRDKKEVCEVDNPAARTPRGVTIDRTHIERAFVSGDLEEITRIHEYGLMSQALIDDLVVLVDEETFDNRRKLDYGREVGVADERIEIFGRKNGR